MERRTLAALLAAKLHAQRRGEMERLLREAQERFDRDRAELTEELRFPREQLAARTEAERELRILLARRPARWRR